MSEQIERPYFKLNRDMYLYFVRCLGSKLFISKLCERKVHLFAQKIPRNIFKSDVNN